MECNSFHSNLFRSLFILLLAPSFALAQVGYDIATEGQARVVTRPHQGQPTLFVTVQFTIRHMDGRPATDVAKEEIVVEEDGRRVSALDIHRPRASDPLTVMLVVDASGSMEQDRKLAEAKQAAQLFLDTLEGAASCGLILFDHRLRLVEPPQPLTDRERLRQQIEAAPAAGGTAYLDATRRAIELLRPVSGRKAILLLSDGIDLNSQAKLADVIREANLAEVPIYAVGVGQPGKQEPVNTVLVLDQSGSMNEPAGDDRAVSKLLALRRAAGRFLDGMRPGARVSLLPFSSRPEPATPFLHDRIALREALGRLQADGETACLDAIYDALETLEAARPLGKRAVIALTDGIDNASRRRVSEVIDRARQTRTPIHLLGLGRGGAVDEDLLRQLASVTGGSYHAVQNEEQLIEVFERLAIQLHDDGFDEVSLRDLAARTGGKFVHARQPGELSRHYRALADELQSTYTVTFPSGRQTHDGTARGIDISVVRDGVRVSGVARLGYQVHGVVVPRMDPAIFLTLLGLLVLLLVFPGMIRRLAWFVSQ